MTEEDFVYRGVYLEIQHGWHDLVKPLIDFVLDNGGSVAQVKEKFGGLRFYYDKPSDCKCDESLWRAFSLEVSRVEDLSYTICEFTGKPGKPMSIGGRGWVKTVSPEIAEELGYDKDVKFF